MKFAPRGGAASVSVPECSSAVRRAIDRQATAARLRREKGLEHAVSDQVRYRIEKFGLHASRET